MTKGNQGRRGAQRKTNRKSDKATETAAGNAGGKASGKPTPLGSGGKHRRALSGKGPTPKAQDRTYHAAYRRKELEERSKEKAALRAQAQQRTRVRLQPGNELVVGRNAVIEAAGGGIKIEKVFVSSDPGDGRMRDVTAALAHTGAPFVEVTRRDLDVASGGAVHQGIGVEVAEYEYWDLDELLVKALEKPSDTPGLLLALDHVTDPHNLGAVLRSGAAFGADGIILPERRSAGVGVTAWKVSAGAAAKVPAARVKNLVQSLRRCQDAGFFVVGLEGDASETVRHLSVADVPLVIVTGAEGTGLSRLVKETCDVLVSIPISGMESLNAAVATGIVLYEVAQQRLELRADTE